MLSTCIPKARPDCNQAPNNFHNKTLLIPANFVDMSRFVGVRSVKDYFLGSAMNTMYSIGPVPDP